MSLTPAFSCKGSSRVPRRGSTIGLSNTISRRDDSRARIRVPFADYCENISGGSDPDVTSVGEKCEPCGSPPRRTDLINMKCRFFHSFTGCTWADCRFLHNEPIQDVVFHDGSEINRTRPVVRVAPGPLAEVKIFIGNLAPDVTSAYVVNIASPYGEVDRCDMLRSSLKNGRRPAVLYMKSDAQADVAIDAINQHVDGEGQRPYARKEYSKPLEARPMRLMGLLQATKTATKVVGGGVAPIKTVGVQEPPPVFASSMPVGVNKVLTPKKMKKPVLVDADGWCSPRKTFKLGRSVASALAFASTFDPLYDLPGDWDCQNDGDRQDDDDPDNVADTDTAAARIDDVDAEVAVFTPTVAPLSIDPVVDSPTSIMSGVWVDADAQRKERVMSPMAFLPPVVQKCNTEGWCVLSFGPAYSDC